MKQHGKKARQERALERLKKAKVENSKGYRKMHEWEAKNGSPVPGDEYLSYAIDWQERREEQIAILEERIARS